MYFYNISEIKTGIAHIIQRISIRLRELYHLFVYLRHIITCNNNSRVQRMQKCSLQ